MKHFLALLLLPACASVPVTTTARVEPPQTVTVVPPPGEGPLVRKVVAAIDPVRDPRASTRAQRAPALLRVEVQQLERLLTVTPADASDRPLLRRRIAEDYVELRKAGVTAASTKALAQYDAILRESPSYPLLDEVVYYSALEREAMGDLPNARRGYLDLVMKAPQSPLVAYAYYAFGQMFWDEAQTDPTKYAPALQAYEEAFSRGRTALTPEAGYRLMNVLRAQGEDDKADQMRERIEHEFPTSAAAKRIAASRDTG